MDPSAEVDAALPWADAERAALRERRSLAGVDAGAPTVGLAISGGGVRSATFGLGLLRGMARAGLLPRIDYLSTVSGGGFVGAMYGRLVSRLGVHAAQVVLARDESPVLEWLRRNGRYLAPAGARDLGIAVVTYLRAMIAIHGESLLTGLLFAVLVMTPHLLQQAGPRFDAAHWEPWRTLWWPLALALWLALAPGLMSAYWVARDAPDP
ncbi:MAG: patatin-like phospholipase family protein, partial [Betaproteobacteria bacterium]